VDRFPTQAPFRPTALLLTQSLAGSVMDWSNEPRPVWLTAPSAQHRTNVWFAMGMLMTHLKLLAGDALARLRRYAYSHDSDVDDLARQLLEGSLELDRIDA
jgi:hypothetical protein